MRLTLAPLLLLAIACEPEDEVIAPIGEWTPPAQATGTTVLPAVGTAPVRVAIRAEGPEGAAVPGEITGVTVDGEAVTVDVDGGGVGVVLLDEPGVYTVSAGTTEEVVVFGPGDAPPIDLMPRALAQDSLVEAYPANGGALGRSAGAIWFIPTHGAPMSVFDMGANGVLDGMSVGDIDRDGLTDAVAWNAGTVRVFRGHPTAGLVLVGSIESTERTATHATLGDANGDEATDIVITWAEDPRFELEVWSGDNAFGFAVDETIRLRQLPFSVSVGDNQGSGRNQITVIDGSNPWSRYVYSLDSYSLTGPQVDGVTFTEDDVSYSADFNGDGADDLFVYGDRELGVDRNVQSFDLSEAFDSTLFSAGTQGAGIAFADSNNDGRVDVWVAQQTGEVFIARQLMDTPRQLQVWDAPDAGPIAAVDQNGDHIPELFVGGESTWDWAWGGSTNREGEVWWSPAASERVFEVGYTTPPALARRDPNASRLDAVGFMESGTTVDLVVTGVFPGPTPLVSELASYEISTDNADGVDVALCGDVAYALTTTQLVVVSFADAAPAELGRVAVSGGREVACGQGPSGSDVAVLTDSAVDLYTSAGVAAGTEAATGVQAIALGGGALVTCSSAGCDVAVAPDGTVVRTSDTGLEIGERTLVGSGAISTFDPSEDGVGEALLYDGRSVIWLDAVDGELRVRQRAHTDLDVEGAVVAVDLFAQGRRVLLGSRDGDLVASTGRMEPESETPDE